MVFSVVVFADPVAGSPVILRDDAAPSADLLAARTRFIALTEDRGEALRWMELLRKECQGEAAPASSRESERPEL
jgi:hypothetical protein